MTNKKQCPIYCSEKWGKEIKAAYNGPSMVDISFLNYIIISKNSAIKVLHMHLYHYSVPSGLVPNPL